MSDTPPPRRISDREIPYNLANHIFPVDPDGQPVLLGMPGTADRFLPIFSTPEKLDELFVPLGITYHRIKLITDQDEFLHSLAISHPPFRLRLAVDPHRHAGGSVRFHEISITNPHSLPEPGPDEPDPTTN